MATRDRVLRLVRNALPLTAVIVLALAGVALASVSVGNVDGIWGVIDAGGSDPGATCDGWATGPGDTPTAISETDPGIQTPPNTDENQVRYGGFDSCAAWGGRSGFGFDGNSAPVAPVNTPFYLGTFTHYNRSTGSLDPFNYDDLDISVPVTCSGGAVVVPVLEARVSLDETTNVAPCPYPGEKLCTDKVTITEADPEGPGLEVPFTCDGKPYELEFLGFVEGEDCDVAFSGEGSNEFITEEDTNSSACLWARIDGPDEPEPTAVPPTPVPPAPVPEPGSILLLTGALAAAGAYLRTRRHG
jgi:hypothetical protein